MLIFLIGRFESNVVIKVTTIIIANIAIKDIELTLTSVLIPILSVIIFPNKFDVKNNVRLDIRKHIKEGKKQL